MFPSPRHWQAVIGRLPQRGSAPDIRLKRVAVDDRDNLATAARINGGFRDQLAGMMRVSAFCSTEEACCYILAAVSGRRCQGLRAIQSTPMMITAIPASPRQLKDS